MIKLIPWYHVPFIQQNQTAYTSAPSPAPLLGYNTESPLGSSRNMSGAENCPAILHSMFLEQLQSAIPTVENKTSHNMRQCTWVCKTFNIHRKLPCKPKFPIGPISRFLFHSFCFGEVEVMSATYVCWHRPVEIWQREPTVFRPSGHWQMMSPANIVHVPPFWQGFSSHSSNTAWTITIMFILTKHFGVGLHSQSLCIPVSNTAQSYSLNKTLGYCRTGFNCVVL